MAPGSLNFTPEFSRISRKKWPEKGAGVTFPDIGDIYPLPGGWKISALEPESFPAPGARRAVGLYRSPIQAISRKQSKRLQPAKEG
jgi:hypothetical protein